MSLNRPVSNLTNSNKTDKWIWFDNFIRYLRDLQDFTKNFKSKKDRAMPLSMIIRELSNQSTPGKKLKVFDLSLT